MTEMTEKLNRFVNEYILDTENFDICYKNKVVGHAQYTKEDGQVRTDVWIHDKEIADDLIYGKKEIDYGISISLETDGSIKVIPCEIVDVEGK